MVWEVRPIPIRSGLNKVPRPMVQEKSLNSIFSDRSLDNSDASEPHMKTHTERKTESTFQRKITVSQTQL